jgi:hypothetical protein
VSRCGHYRAASVLRPLGLIGIDLPVCIRRALHVWAETEDASLRDQLESYLEAAREVKVSILRRDHHPADPVWSVCCGDRAAFALGAEGGAEPWACPRFLTCERLYREGES